MLNACFSAVFKADVASKESPLLEVSKQRANR